MSHRTYIKNNKYLTLAVLAFAAIAFYVHNVLSAEFSDDFMYKYVLSNGLPDYSQPIKSISDIIKSQIDHYFTWNGRTITHIIVQLVTGLLGKTVFNLLNTIVFCIFVFLLKSNISNKSDYNPFVYILTIALVLLLPEPNLTFLWMTGSINYLWTATITLCFIKLIETVGHRPFNKRDALLLILVFVMGWGHEGITFPVAFSLIVIYSLHLKENINRMGFWMAILFMLGACTSAFSPATAARSGVTNGVTVSALVLKAFSAFVVLKKLHIIHITIIVMVVMWFKQRTLLKSLIKENAFLLLATVPALGIIFVSGFQSPRTAFGLEFYCLIFLLRMVGRIVEYANSKTLNRIGAVLFMCVGLFYGFVIYHAVSAWQETQHLIYQIKNNKDCIIGTDEHDSGIFSSYIRTMIMEDKYRHAMYYDAHDPNPQNIAAVYHRDSLIFLPQDFIDEIKLNPQKFEDFDMNSPYEFFIKKVSSEQIDSVIWKLGPTDFSKMPFFYRPIAKRLGRYVEKLSGCEYWKVIYLNGQRFLIVKKDHVWDDRRNGILVIEKESAEATDDQYQKAA